MAQFDKRYAAQVGTRAETVEIDAGLRAYMLRVYNYMAIGVGLTGVVAYAMSVLAGSSLSALTPFGEALYLSPLRWVVMFAPLAFVMFLSFRVQRMSVATAQAAFWLFAAVMGASISWIFLVFTDASISRVFFISAATFGGLSLWGYTTKRDISGWGSFLIMGVIGIIIASIVNIFLASTALQFAVSVITVLVFAGLTAYDTQRIRATYYQVQGDAAALSKSAIMGALALYLDFINIFMSLLSLFGSRE